MEALYNKIQEKTHYNMHNKARWEITWKYIEPDVFAITNMGFCNDTSIQLFPRNNNVWMEQDQIKDVIAHYRSKEKTIEPQSGATLGFNVLDSLSFSLKFSIFIF